MKTYCHSRSGLSLCALTAGLTLTVSAGLSQAAEMPLFEAYTTTGSVGVVNAGVGMRGSGGVGLLDDVAVPDGAQVAKAYLYWAGLNRPHDGTADPTVTFTRQGAASVNLTADDIYAVPFENPTNPGYYIWDANHSVFVADVTDYVAAGTFDYTVSDLDMSKEFGAGLQIVYEDQALPARTISLFQGHDFAFSEWTGGQFHRTNVLNYTFEAAKVDRLLEVTFVVAGAESDRPDQLWYDVGVLDGQQQLPDELIANNLGTVLDTDPLTAIDGNVWDTVVRSISIPAGSTYASFQLQSGGGTAPATPDESFSWVSTSFSMAPITPVPEPATLLLLGLGASAFCIRRRR